MRLTALQYFLWALELAARVALALTMVRCQRWRRWPFLFTLTLFEIAVTGLLGNFSGLNHYRHYREYFYTFWTAEKIRPFLGLAVIFEIVRAIPGMRFAPRNLAALFVGIAIAIASGCAWMASSGGTPTLLLTMKVLALERCIAVVWGAFAIVLFFAIWLCGLGWTETPLRLASGFLSLTLIGAADAFAMSAVPASAQLIHRFADLLKISAWLYWSVSIRRDDKIAAPHLTEPLLQVFKALTFNPQNRTQ